MKCATTSAIIILKSHVKLRICYLGNECMCTDSRVNKGTRRGSCTELNRTSVLMQQMEFQAHTDEPLANKSLHFK